MANRANSNIHFLIQRIASSRLGAWFFSHTLHHLDRISLKLTGGRKTLSSTLAGLPILVLTTTGAKSGLARTTPVLGIRDPAKPERFAVIASNWGQDHHPAWYYNLKANPQVVCSIDGQARPYLAYEAGGEEYERYWQRAVETYIGFPLYQQRAGTRKIPVMVLKSQDPPLPTPDIN